MGALGAAADRMYVIVAGRQGFEPWERSHVQRFSRPPHSTTLPPPRSGGGFRACAKLMQAGNYLEIHFTRMTPAKSSTDYCRGTRASRAQGFLVGCFCLW